MKYRLLAIDVDGTLVGKNSTVSGADREALAAAVRRGVYVSLCTGRAPRACTGILKQLSLDGFHTFYDGSLVSRPGGEAEIYARPLDPATLRQALEFSHHNGIDFEMYSAAGYFAERETWSTNAHREFFGVEAVLGPFDDILRLHRIVKGGLVATDDAGREKINFFQSHFQRHFHFTWVRTPAYPGVDFINITGPEVSKGRAVKQLASYLKISPGEIMAIGDGRNDIPLLAAAGFAVAMPEAPEDVRAVADYVTCGVERGGVAHAVSKFLL